MTRCFAKRAHRRCKWPMTTVEVFAPAKINLTLHVTGQRADGYHLLDSLVAFADVGDTLTIRPLDQLALTIDGPEAGDLASEPDNLVLQAARLLAPDAGAALRLTKRLPVASGIGGGSADAAAALRGLARFWGKAMPSPADIAALGADVPVCLSQTPRRMGGIGEELSSVPPLPDVGVVLANPRVAVSTPKVFARLSQKSNPPMADQLPGWRTAGDLFDWLAAQRNDLLTPAMELQPVIADVIAALRQSGCRFVSMSGSGATCFGLFAPDEPPDLSAVPSAWWIAKGRLLQSDF